MSDFERAENFNQAITVLGENVRKRLEYIGTSQKAAVQEVRLRIGCPLQVTQRGSTLYVTQEGKITDKAENFCYEVTRQDVEESFRAICGYSVHAHQNEVKNGYITVRGGHRAGICGTAVIDNGEVSGIKDISSINLRIAQQMTGCAGKMLPSQVLYSEKSLILAGPPCSGKTTLLRDTARALSGMGIRVAVVDERSEISAMYQGKAQNKLGSCCDVLNGYPKPFGIMTALRALSPQVILCDEIGDLREIEQIQSGFYSGVRFVITLHATDMEGIRRKPGMKELLAGGEFGYAVFLGAGENLGKTVSMEVLGEKTNENHGTCVDDMRVASDGIFAV